MNTTKLRHITNPQEIAEWLKHAMVGESVVYFEGLLMRARAMRDTAADMPQALATAGRVWGFATLGRVALVQKRIADGHYLYIAQKLQ